jgi:hypothetical protein
MSTYIVASLPLPLYCGILLLAKQHETIQGLSCSITAGFDCGIMLTLLRLDCRLDWSSHRTTCGITANLSDLYVAFYLYSGIHATSILLWDYAAIKAVWDHTRSSLRHHCRLSFALTCACDFIVVLRHHCHSLRHPCRLVANCHLPTPGESCCFI